MTWFLSIDKSTMVWHSEKEDNVTEIVSKLERIKIFCQQLS